MTESKSNSDPTNNRYSFEDLVAEISSVEWFENVGSAVPDRIRFLVDKYLAGLGCTTDSIRMVRDVRQLEDCIKNNFDPTWMAAESTAFNNLLDQFDQSKYDETFNVEVQQVISNLSSRILMLADNRLTGSNRYLARVAAGSAAETCFRYVLESTVDNRKSKTFTSKFEMFQMGRWPLCLSNGSYLIY